MKKILLLFFLQLSVAVASQVYKASNGVANLYRLSSNYTPAEIEFNTGEVKKGLISGFIENENIEFGAASQLSNFEHQLNLDDNRFFFKNDENAKPEKLSQNNLKRISLLNQAKVKTYYLIAVFAVDKKTQKLDDLKRSVWLPLLRENDKMNIFGFNLFVNNRYVYTYYYLSKDNKTAIRFFDDNMLLCGFDCSKTYYASFLKSAFVEECPAMENQVNIFMQNFTKEQLKQLQKDKEAAIKKVKKEGNLSPQEEKNKLLELEENVILGPIENLIKEYQTNCK